MNTISWALRLASLANVLLILGAYFCKSFPLTVIALALSACVLLGATAFVWLVNSTITKTHESYFGKSLPEDVTDSVTGRLRATLRIDTCILIASYVAALLLHVYFVSISL